MPAEFFANRGRSTLAAGISAGATSLTIAPLTAGRDFPTSVPFRVVCGTEIIIVGARSGTTFSALTRGAEGTTAASHLAGAVIAHEVTAGILNFLRDIEDHTIPASAQHGAATVAALFDQILAAIGGAAGGGYGVGPYGEIPYGLTPSGILVADEGTPVGRAALVNFTGAGVAASYSSGRVDVTIDGGGGGAASFASVAKWGID